MIDLHLHSTKSDGTLTPAELIQHAAKKKLKVVSLTDHDTLAGLYDASHEAKQLGLTFIPGVEISAKSPSGSLHILGYGVHDTYCPILKKLKKFRTARNRRNRKIIEKLQHLGCDISADDLEISADNSCIGKPHIAKAMVNKKIVSTFDEAFEQYLGPNGAAYIEKEKFTPKDAIQLIRDAGGVAFLAHPKSLELSNEELIKFIKDLKLLGLNGIEAYYPKHSKAETEFFLSIAQNENLMVSAGSDFHGTNKPDIAIGECHLGSPVSVKDISESLFKKQL